MQHATDRVDITEFVANGNAPIVTVKRAQTSSWHVRIAPMDLAKPSHTSLDWSLVRSGELVVVPLHPYVLPSMQPIDVALGTLALSRELFSGVHVPFSLSYVVVGEPLELLDNGTVRMWLGCAVRR